MQLLSFSKTQFGHQDAEELCPGLWDIEMPVWLPYLTIPLQLEVQLQRKYKGQPSFGSCLILATEFHLGSLKEVSK